MKFVAALVFILIAASAATFFVTGLESEDDVQAMRTSPLDEAYDYYVQDMHATRFAADGSAVSQLRAERVTHFPDGDRADLVQPDFAAFDSDAWQVSASTGTLSPDTQRNEDRLELEGNVQLRKPGANGDFVEIDTAALTLFLASEEAESASAVELRTRSSRLNGNGMQARLAKNEFKLNDGNGTHVPATNP